MDYDRFDPAHPADRVTVPSAEVAAPAAPPPSPIATAVRDHADLLSMNARSLAQQSAVRRATFSPSETKALRPFSIWEISTFMFDVAADTLRKKLADDPTLPQGGQAGLRILETVPVEPVDSPLLVHFRQPEFLPALI